MGKIKGGYYVKARIIQESEIAHCPPHFREIWDWLLMKATHKPYKVGGKVLQRGQLYTSYKKISDGLKWKVGYRTERYKKHEIQAAIKRLTKLHMATTTKTTRGMIVTIVNYDKYQNPENYETYNGNYNESTLYNKNKRISTISSLKFAKKVPIPDNISLTNSLRDYAQKKRWTQNIDFEFERFVAYHKANGSKFKDWHAAFQKWIQNDIKWHPDHQEKEMVTL